MPVDPSTSDRCGFFSDQPDSRAIAAHEGDLGSSPHELDRSGSPDAASGSREHNDRHTTDLTLRPATGTLGSRSSGARRLGRIVTIRGGREPSF